jgi:hypothetical protein
MRRLHRLHLRGRTGNRSVRNPTLGPVGIKVKVFKVVTLGFFKVE